ncbi:exported hypothetical protein [Candidatus Sulfopaludibacter sp. SbA6]|nr:exported hypothetical protein [Candidatus Sulfopaludibacter sp. SbA6]
MVRETKEGPGVRRALLLVAAFALGAGSWAGWTGFQDRGRQVIKLPRGYILDPTSPYYYNTLAAASGAVPPPVPQGSAACAPTDLGHGWTQVAPEQQTASCEFQREALRRLNDLEERMKRLESGH